MALRLLLATPTCGQIFYDLLNEYGIFNSAVMYIFLEHNKVC